MGAGWEQGRRQGRRKDWIKLPKNAEAILIGIKPQPLRDPRGTQILRTTENVGSCEEQKLLSVAAPKYFGPRTSSRT